MFLKITGEKWNFLLWKTNFGIGLYVYFGIIFYWLWFLILLTLWINNIKQKKAEKEGDEPTWNASASHVSHQVGAPEGGDPDAAEPSKAANKVSFDTDQPEAEAKTGNERVSLDQPPDLFVTSAATPTVVEPPAASEEVKEAKPAQQVEEVAAVAAASPKADASNTGTAKRKKDKKKRDEVGQSAHKPVFRSCFYFCFFKSMAYLNL